MPQMHHLISSFNTIYTFPTKERNLDSESNVVKNLFEASRSEDTC